MLRGKPRTWILWSREGRAFGAVGLEGRAVGKFVFGTWVPKKMHFENLGFDKNRENSFSGRREKGRHSFLDLGPEKKGRQGFRDLGPEKKEKHGFQDLGPEKKGRQGFRDLGPEKREKHGFRDLGPEKKGRQGFRDLGPDKVFGTWVPKRRKNMVFGAWVEKKIRMKEWHPERREVLDQHSDKEREGEEHWQTMWRYLKAFFLTNIMVTTCWNACTHTLIRANLCALIIYAFVWLVGWLIGWVIGCFDWLFVCSFVCLFVGCWCVGLLVCFFVRLFVCSVMSLFILFCMFVNVRPLMGRHLTFPPSAGRGGTYKQHQRYKPHASAAPEQRLSLQRGPCQFVCVCGSVYRSVCSVDVLALFPNLYNLFAFERATLCRLFVCMCVGAA